MFLSIAAMPDTRTLLIIDDCTEDRKIYRRYLLKDPHQSYQILEADSAEDGLALCQKTPLDVILLDFYLPSMTGLEVLDRLKQQKLENAIPVIMLTGHGDEAIAVQAMKRGAQDYLAKRTLKPDVLQLAVRNAIEKSCLQIQLQKTQERQRLIATTALRIRQSLNLGQILNTAVAEVQQLLKCDRVVVYQFDPSVNPEISNELRDVEPPLVLSNRLQEICLQSEAQKHAYWGQKPIIINSYKAGKHASSRSNIFKARANLAVPITMSRYGEPTPKIWGVLIAHQDAQERQWETNELEMLNEVSVQLAIAIQQAELLAQTQAALEKEKQLNAFKSQIAATVSHEYRTPLASILAAASTLKQYRDELNEGKQQRFLQLIEEKARHMSRLVDDMLTINQFELNKTQCKPIPIDLLQYFADLMEEQRATLGVHHDLSFRITGNPLGFWGDRNLLRQIFVNLVSNAIKYSPDGGNIEVHLIGQDEQIIFSVKDEGIGIPLEDQENLFQSFHRGSNVDTIPGTGLGLAITKACVNLHGGEISLESQEGQSTKVTVSLPKKTNH